MSKTPLNITPLSALRDNYIWTLSHNSQCIIVDPGDEKPVIQWLEQTKNNLSALLITHRHWDHTNGIHNLKPYLKGPIIGPECSKIPCDITLKDQQSLDLGSYLHTEHELLLQAIATPGHTDEHLCYIIDNQYLLTGDTLFSGGCGRIFDGTAEQLYHSLEKIALLNDELLIYCGHEYTLDNLKFALTLEPNNRDLHEHYILVKNKTELNECTLPSTLAIEKKINPFLRANNHHIQEHLTKQTGDHINQPIQAFKHMRALKDQFNP
ncbi:MAG TPA: hydroxyacylglutathione hydrolase [Gammaproteobacteria bacterium]|nr:hydroxyacylglutathione hydrolase [Gammaproteobacteria bacterium]